MEAKPISASRVTLSRMMGPQDANTLGNVHGGVIMKMVDEAGALAAMRHAQNIVVTVAVDSMTFKEPIRIGAVVTTTAELSYVGRTSMEVRVDVTAENPIEGIPVHTNTAYLVYVAITADGQPREVPSLLLESDQEKARWEAARARQTFRKQQAQEERLTHG